MNNKDFKWTEKRFGLTFANILKKIYGEAVEGGEEIRKHFTVEETGNITFKDLQEENHELVTHEGFDGILKEALSTNAVTVTTWLELKTLRDNNELIPGIFYRITDYVNTTDVTFDGLTSHQFDIILLALTSNTLAEEGWVAMHDDNIYDVTFNDGVTKKCYIYKFEMSNSPNEFYCNIVPCDTLLGYGDIPIGEQEISDLWYVIINEDNKTCETNIASDDEAEENLTYNDFQNTNFATWKIWYSLDNNTARFSWADDSVDETTLESITFSTHKSFTVNRNPELDKVDGGVQFYGWGTGMFTKTLDIVVGETQCWNSVGVLLNTISAYTPAHQGTGPNGRGVIYRITEDLGLCKLQWNELKTIRDSKALVADTKYRIVDYQCTTVQENTRSAGHQFDIVLLALSENKLAEEGWAMMNESNAYDVTFNDGVTKRCYLWFTENDGEADYFNVVDISTHLGIADAGSGTEIIIDESNKTATCDGYASTDLIIENLPYNYFQNSNLSAWKVWYCLDNDTSRFAWADDNLPSIVDEDIIYVRKPSSDIGDLLAWYNENYNIYDYTKTEHPSIGDETFDDEGGTNSYVLNVFGFGRGVIYRLIDEFNNDVAYDFKNIQFMRTLADGGYDENGEETWCYTIFDSENNTDASLLPCNRDNKILNHIDSNTSSSTFGRVLLSNNIIIWGSGAVCSGNIINCDCSNNIIQYQFNNELINCYEVVVDCMGSLFLSCNNYHFEFDAENIYVRNTPVVAI